MPGEKIPLAAARIARDLGLSRFVNEPADRFIERVLYSAAGEWLRMISFDVDPVLGNNKLGVTDAYLLSRAKDVFAVLFDSVSIESSVFSPENKAKFLSTAPKLLFDIMLEAKYFWRPTPKTVVASIDGVGETYCGYVRRFSPKAYVDASLYPIVSGLSVINKTDNEAVSVSSQMMALQRLSDDIFGNEKQICSTSFVNPEDIVDSLVQKSSSFEKFPSDRTIYLDLSEAVLCDEERRFLNCYAWPYDVPFDWVNAKKWRLWYPTQVFAIFN